MSKSIEIAVKACNQSNLDIKYNKTRQCAPKDEILRVASYLKMYLVIQNMEFDDSKFEPYPFKPYNKPYFITSQFNKSMTYYLLMCENQVFLWDSWFYGGPVEDSYLETKIDYQTT